MAVQILLNTLLCFMIILFAYHVKTEDISTYLRPRRGVHIDEKKCELGNVTADRGTLQCIEKCHLMPEVRKRNLKM